MNNQLLTKPTKASETIREWHLVDADNRIIGRVATEIAQLLIGKSKPNFSRNIDGGDIVVVINASKIRSTGKKEKEKMYSTYSGFPGGMKEKPLWKIREEKPTEIVRHAVWGMLPKNKLRHRMITRLHIYQSDTHPYTDRFMTKGK